MLPIFIFLISAFLSVDRAACAKKVTRTLLPCDHLWTNWSPDSRCLATVKTDAGLIQGIRNEDFYSFLNVNYAKQPLGKLRFQELQAPEPWSNVADATTEGPICPQQNIFYGDLMTNQQKSEACIHANVYVPRDAPIVVQHQLAKSSRASVYSPLLLDGRPKVPALPIFVFVHGGGFAFGSGDPDVHGPEHIVKKGVIVITFNYRIRSFGFLSLNSTKVPGNAGLRDVITLLKWVRKNAAAFGGNPDDITLGGQSAGAAITHLLALKPERLFKRAILMSGSASRSFYSTSPLNAARMGLSLTAKLGINSTDSEQVFQQLVNTPVEDIEAVTNDIQLENGITDFTPVQEFDKKGVREVVKVDPDELVSSGSANVPTIIGFTDNECHSFKNVFQRIDILSRIKDNPFLVVPVPLIFKLSPAQLVAVAQQIMARYFSAEPTIEEFINLCSESYFIYPAIHSAERGGKDVYLYKFSYVGGASKVLQNATGSHCDSASGCRFASHVEDLLYLFKPHSFPDFADGDDKLFIDWFTTVFTKFIKTGKPTSENGTRHVWQPVSRNRPIQYLDVSRRIISGEPVMRELDGPLLQMKYFFDKLYNLIQKTD